MPLGDLTRGEATKETGTTITFLPDADVFESLDFDFTTIEERMRDTAFLTRGLRIALIDERGEGHRVEFQYEGGIVDFVEYLNETRSRSTSKVISFSGESDEGAVEVAMQWNSSYQESVFSFANNINTIEGGSHLSGFRSALTGALNKYARDKGELKEKDDNLTGEDVREGLTAVISAKLTDPQFEGQTKTKLGNPGMQGFVHSIVNARADRVPRGEPPGRPRGDPQGGVAPRRRAPPRARRATSRAVSRRSRTRRCPASSPTARSRTRRSPSCSSSRATPPAARRSARAIATPRRSCRCAARSSTSRRAGSTRCSRTEIQALITAIGTGVRDEFDIEKARYHKIVLLTDADVDGAHIRTLALTLLFREMQPLIEAGYVYIAKPPLYRLTRGQKHRYIERESELEDILLGDKFEKIEISTGTTSSSSSPRRAGSGSPGCSSSTRAGPRRCAPPTATESSPSCSRPACSRSRSPTSTGCCATSRSTARTARRTRQR